ncbi:NADH dehydrogenase [ubiquinone] 1 beta subcomplex subunit 3 [Diaphorina citri]|uniref:NADH dehydrogenase [ubiquinone] 1 beta subcomplex subunit 3 n=1 Tax=Diaphorina citri TaxID=121845 RepID=A0A1S4EL69_DIACI|nr:NADH dehydrogenase [ubiquinone] 1 beta subcomplex subunit 3 [Diaphorina citri]KAI5703627.1 hypothetical protein M8J75_014233 [Diaphorina citri]KAI5733746.1 hypothetical protein M8J76_015416 [Diaphorina citri]
MGGHGDHHHEPPFKVPDWRVMKLENCPPLQNVERALAAKGLKDPWLRNHIWRYPPEYPIQHWKRAMNNSFYGFKWGLVMFAGTLVIEYTYKFISPPSDHHGGKHH